MKIGYSICNSEKKICNIDFLNNVNMNYLENITIINNDLGKNNHNNDNINDNDNNNNNNINDK